MGDFGAHRPPPGREQPDQLCQRGGAVHLGLAGSQQVEVRSVYDCDPHAHRSEATQDGVGYSVGK